VTLRLLARHLQTLRCRCRRRQPSPVQHIGLLPRDGRCLWRRLEGALAMVQF
jgi:hypothetical protein